MTDTKLEVVPAVTLPAPEEPLRMGTKTRSKPIPENMKATIGWVLYKFATEQSVGHLKQLAEYMAIKIGETLPESQEEVDALITSYLEENKMP